MTEEEIVERIIKCEEKIRDYLEVGKTGYVRKYEEEMYKWEKLLNSVKPTEEDYRRGYNLLQQRIDKAVTLLCEADSLIMVKKYGEANLRIHKAKEILKGSDK